MTKKLVQHCTALARRHAIEVVDLKCIDLAGYLHHISLPYSPGLLDKLVSEGVGFDGSGYGFRRVENSDMVLVPDLSTAVLDPFRKAPTLSFYAHILLAEDRDRPFSQDGRSIARRAQQVLAGIRHQQHYVSHPFTSGPLDETNHPPLDPRRANGSWYSSLSACDRADVSRSWLRVIGGRGDPLQAR